MRNLVFILLLATFQFPVQAAEDEERRPNVIVILTDDQGYGDMSCHGNPWLKTLNLDRMRDEGTRFEDYHVDPVCTPTRAALMTGRHSLRVGAWTVTDGRQLLNHEEVTMANVFRESGYRTGMLGKWHLGDPFPYAPRFRGFDEVVCHRAGGVDEIGNPLGNNYFDDTYFRNGKPEKFEGYCTDVFFEEMLFFIKAKKEKPFFIYLPLNAMHGPFTVANRYADRFRELGLPEKRSLFYGMVENFDENLGRLFSALKEEQLDEETIVVFMGDNGSAGGARVDEGHVGFNAGMRGSKGDTYEGGHRVACFIRWPGQVGAGRQIDELTTHHDWLPTLIDMCNLEPSEELEVDGRNLYPLLKGEEAEWADRTVFVVRHSGDPVPWSAGEKTKQRFPRRAILTKRWRVVDGELYDIERDPGQTKDLAAKHPEVIAKLDRAYQEWWRDAMAHEAACTRFFIGAEEETPTSFTARDWHPTQGQVIWKKEQLADDRILINGFWELDVREQGRYRFRLSRYPDDELQAMGASRARLRIGDIEKELSLEPADETAHFEVNLSVGPVRLQTWLTDSQSGEQRGSYYVTVTRCSQ
ncbi:arylsulfatase [Roseibacillus persicicus]|uniref:arylsulfatase n=1 Tax=Roseibacillus persicicus TaxID=454148 RepID=UPI00398AEA3D